MDGSGRRRRYRIRHLYSMPEATIVHHMGKRTATVWSYRPPFLDGMEIDVFLPLEKAGIEYDGATWHVDRRNEERKRRLCEKRGIRLFRIREIGADPLGHDEDVIWVDPSVPGSLDTALKDLAFRILGESQPDIDSDRDRKGIERLFEGRAASSSVACVRPWLLDQVSPANPYPPEEVGRLPIGSPEYVLWRCRRCGKDYPDYVGKPAAPLCPGCARGGIDIGGFVREGAYTGLIVMTDREHGDRKRSGRNTNGYRRMEHEGEVFWWRPSGFASPSRRNDPESPTWWRCTECGYRWAASAECLLLGQGCPQCGFGWRPHSKLPLHHADRPFVHIPRGKPEIVAVKPVTRRPRRPRRPRSQTSLGEFASDACERTR